ncbi:hypothetical protein BCCGELA001_08070 [Bradyrhizobium sp. CCGE-LA001]|nr:hypothetical protein BCCGELA001_08070 [Bradyrhizobium sp. CCGE-LA001]
MLEPKVVNLIVEGRSDQIIVRSFCEGARIPSMIYPISLVELDCVAPNGEGGDKGRVIRTSAHLSARQIRRICCIIDRDDLPFIDFMYNSHCLITDFASLDMYPLDCDDLAGYTRRHFQKDKVSSREISRVFEVAALASILRWKRIGCVPSAALADIEGSLSFNSGLVELSVKNWIERSRAKGGFKADWDALLASADAIELDNLGDSRHFISVHLLDEVFRHWMKSVHNVKLEPHWIEGHLRGMATYERLRGYDFFQVLSHHCAGELQTI